MSAECEIHGVDLHGDTFSGLVCPVCAMQEATRKLTEGLWEIVQAEPKRAVSEDGMIVMVQPDYRGIAKRALGLDEFGPYCCDDPAACESCPPPSPTTTKNPVSHD